MHKAAADKAAIGKSVSDKVAATDDKVALSCFAMLLKHRSLP